MSASDAIFLMGPLGALILVPASVGVLAVRRRPRWAFRAGVVLLVVVAASWLAYWVNWGWAFDYSDALQTVPAALEAGLEYLAAATAVTAVALALTAGASWAIKRSHS